MKGSRKKATRMSPFKKRTQVGKHSLPLRRNVCKKLEQQKRRQGCRLCILGKINVRAFAKQNSPNSNCQEGNLNYSHPKVAGGLFVASKYSASTNGSSAIL